MDRTLEAQIDQEIARRPYLTPTGRKRVRRKFRLKLRQSPKLYRMPFTNWWDEQKRRDARPKIDQHPRRDTPRYLREARQTFWPPFSRPLSPLGVELLGHPPRPRQRR